MGRLGRGFLAFGSMLAALALLPSTVRDATAAGETRTLSFFHTHTNESATVTYKRGGAFDADGLKQLNWLLRDWRVQEAATMDPRLFDIIWEVYREVGSREPIHVISAYRSPQTNGMLRRASSGVADNSQHMLGKAMDIRLPDVDTARLRAAAMRLQYGGVGFYQSSAFVHVDTGSVRAWPRMTQDQLARLFPDGKTLHLPAGGPPLAGYEQAKAEILARNEALAAQAANGGSRSITSAFAALFGGSKSAEGEKPSPSLPTRTAAYAPVEAGVAQGGAQGAAQVASLIPLPPRRPVDERALLAERAIPAESAAPAERTAEGAGRYTVASLEPVAAEAPTPNLRPLFAPDLLIGGAAGKPRITVVQVRKSPILEGNTALDVRTPVLAFRLTARPDEDLARARRFTGPAVKPLQGIVVAQAYF
jgi:uncharacterized protein YcbK (DUF882 family)